MKILGIIAPFLVPIVLLLKFFGELGSFVSGAALCVPFAGLAILAYLGREQRWARGLSVAIPVARTSMQSGRDHEDIGSDDCRIS